MARTGGFRVDGVEALTARLARVPVSVKSGVNDAVADAADAIVAGARSDVRVDTGALRDGIEARTRPELLSAEVGVFDAELDYGIFQEFGTSKMTAQPFLTPAAEAERQQLPGRVTVSVQAKLP